MRSAPLPRTMLLGILADAQFAEKSIDIAPGDVLLAFTDGVSEIAPRPRVVRERANPSGIRAGGESTGSSDRR